MRLAWLLLSCSLLGCAQAARPAVSLPNDPRLVTVDADGQFVRGDGARLTEAQFRELYRARTQSRELDDELAYKEAKRESAFAVGLGVGSLALGTTGAVLLAKSKNCASTAPTEAREGCVKTAVDGVAIAATGAFVLGCELVAGVDCVRKDMVMKVKVGSVHLDRERASFYADRYNDAVLGETLDEAPAAPNRATRKAHLTLTPSGLGGSF